MGRPDWMTDEEWAEYRATSAEYANEVGGDDCPPDPYEDDAYAELDELD